MRWPVEAPVDFMQWMLRRRACLVRGGAAGEVALLSRSSYMHCVQGERLRPKTGLMAQEMMLCIRSRFTVQYLYTTTPYPTYTHPHPYLKSLNLFSPQQ